MNTDLDTSSKSSSQKNSAQQGESQQANLAFVPFTEAVLCKLSETSRDNRPAPTSSYPQLVPFDLKYETFEILVENQWVTVVAA